MERVDEEYYKLTERNAIMNAYNNGIDDKNEYYENSSPTNQSENSVCKNFKVPSYISDQIEKPFSETTSNMSPIDIKRKKILYDIKEESFQLDAQRQAQKNQNLNMSQFKSFDSFINEEDTIMTSNRLSNGQNVFKSKRSHREAIEQQKYFSVDHYNNYLSEEANNSHS